MTLCACGCGQPTLIATHSNRARGVVAGEPLKFVHGHNRRRPGVAPLTVRCTNCGSARHVAVDADGRRNCSSCGHSWTARPRQGELTVERILARVNRTETCWLWTGATTEFGYGVIQLRQPRRTVTVHRSIYELVNGSIPDGMVVCHRCDVPACCRPDHLFLGTVADNNADMVRKGRHWRQRQEGVRV